MTFSEFSLAGSTVGACSSAMGTSFSFAGTSEAIAYSKEVPSFRISWPFLPVTYFRNSWAASWFLEVFSTPPPETDTNAPGSWFLK